MLPFFRVKKQPDMVVPDLGSLSGEWLRKSPNVPITIRQINRLPENAKRRVCRALLPPDLLVRFNIDPVTWRGPDGSQHVMLKAEAETAVVSLSARATPSPDDEFLYLEISDSSVNSVNIDFLLLSDPSSLRFSTDYTEDGRSTLFGTVSRNLAVEEQAMRAGLSPAQVRQGLAASGAVMQQLEAFLVTCGHTAYFMEPLTYVAAWLSERRGFAYVRGHLLMDDIHREFQPGGRLHRALDGSSPFRQPDQWQTVRGRAWAIHDGILQAIDARWDELRMVKRVGHRAGVETFPGAVY
jgi:hypothetical protein